ncbi:PEP-CTERM sorting domain-containing protein [Paludibaculum fermentans]|uniref:PEP-CTERM sorting domain-containing protein n=1 Tax=Paludibaculum fermentans TaxID=1473598 RepID=UPI003EB73769
MTIKLLQPVLLGLLCGFPACADSISVVFTPSLLTGSQGVTLTFQGALGTTTSDLPYDAYLNSLSISLAGPLDWSFDSTPFMANAPLQLASGAATGPFDFFSVTVPLGLAPGLYDGAVSVLGGTDPDSEVILGVSGFQVQVEEAPAPVPEPASSLLLLAGGVGGVLLLRLRQRR